jgi:hypothetical protein
MKRLIAALALSLAPLSHTVQAAETQTIAYPTAEEASFLITAPENWKITPAEQAGDFFQLEGPTGAIFSFRTIEGTEKSLDAAIKESVKELNERFDDMQLGDAEDWKPHGLTGLYAVGTGKIKGEDTAVKVGVGWCALEDGKIAEMWFVAEDSDTKGIKQAEDIANSMSAPAQE